MCTQSIILFLELLHRYIGFGFYFWHHSPFSIYIFFPMSLGEDFPKPAKCVKPKCILMQRIKNSRPEFNCFKNQCFIGPLLTKGTDLRSSEQGLLILWKIWGNSKKVLGKGRLFNLIDLSSYSFQSSLRFNSHSPLLPCPVKFCINIRDCWTRVYTS